MRDSWSDVPGYVGLTFSVALQPGSYRVEWAAEGVPNDIQVAIVAHATRWLGSYVLGHSNVGANVVVTEVIIDPTGRGDYQRAVENAMRYAIIRLNLPAAVLYAPPTAEEWAEDFGLARWRWPAHRARA
jgi:hypothetical protein